MRRWISLVLELFTAVMVPIAWSMMLFKAGANGALSSAGLTSLKYFTVLSNLLAGLGSLLSAIFMIKGARKKRLLPGWLLYLRFVGAAAVSVTFLTVLLLLGPVYGHYRLYNGANLWFHLIIPLVSAAGFVLLRSGKSITLKGSLISAAPTVVYGMGYIANMLINGVSGNDFYGFLTWGTPAGIGIFAFLIAMTWGVSLLLRLPHRGGTARVDTQGR